MSRFEAMVPLFVFLLMLAAPLLLMWFTQHHVPASERARFMLECTHEWMLSADDCRSILEGEDPPPSADGC